MILPVFYIFVANLGKNMELVLLAIGKTKTNFVEEGCREYIKRLSRYCSFSTLYLPDVKSSKSLSVNAQKLKEGELFLSKIGASDMVVLLDEHGREFTSPEFAAWIEKNTASGKKRILFCIGGPYGFSQDVYDRCDYKISLSRMTFNHEMVRLFFTEQLYRGFSILSGSPYHHE